ncbi:MAG: phosphatidylglycerol lysyltransferase domain-containing protein [Clostridiales Family XIII bacterium]|nr:phosphatidylglycerol lysyltransferase domain-containing protein [Clostridiales Family XIII bacterium]
MMASYLFENRVTLENRPLLEKYLQGFDYKTSGLSFSSLFMWRNINRFSWQIFGDYLCIAAADNLEPEMGASFMFPPLTKTGTYDPAELRKTILAAKAYFESKGEPFIMMLVPFHMNEILSKAMPGELTFEADRPNFDYVYNTEDLISLRGRDFHAKRNHLNYFLKNYTYEYTEMTTDMAPEAMRFIREFNERKNLSDPHERELLEMEEEAMKDVFVNLDAVGYLTGVILIDGKMQALSIGGQLGTKTVTVHVEKANIEYRGLYQAINNEFCKHMAAHVKRINREEDMGIPGLRKAKLSYNPVKLIEKYTVRIK